MVSSSWIFFNLTQACEFGNSENKYVDHIGCLLHITIICLKTLWLRTINVYYLTVSKSQVVLPQVSRGFQPRCQLRLHHLKADWDARSISKMAPSLAGGLSSSLACGRKIDSLPYGPLHRIFWVSLWHGSWLRETERWRERGGESNIFSGLASGVTYHHFCHVLLVYRPTLIQLGRRLCKSMNTMR